eukprot:31614-Prorocentrum_minimum.AAC.1
MLACLCICSHRVEGSSRVHIPVGVKQVLGERLAVCHHHTGQAGLDQHYWWKQAGQHPQIS